MEEKEVSFLHSLKEIAFRLNKIKRKCNGRKVGKDISDVEKYLNELYDQFRESLKK